MKKQRMLLSLTILGIALSTIASAYSLETNRLLAEARQATAKYQNVNSAIADGYFSTVECVESPFGTMGIHYVNPALMDRVVDETQPEILLYAPTKNGFRLVGVEYFIPAACVSSAPELFGEDMDGPMSGHGPGQPEHYDLHVWLWQANPNGIFEEWHPNINC